MKRREADHTQSHNKKSVVDKYMRCTLRRDVRGLDSGFAKTGKFENQIANDILSAPSETDAKNLKDSKFKN